MLFIGSGAVNLSVAGWLRPYVDELSFLVRTPDNELISKGKFRCKYGDDDWKEFDCSATSEISELTVPDIVIVGVKSYALEEVCVNIVDAFGFNIPVVSVLNGVRHIEVLEKKFKRVILATIFYNAYRLSPSEAIVLSGSIALSSNTDCKTIGRLNTVLSKSIPITVVDKPTDVAYCKLVMNLGNALLTMVAYHDNRNRDLKELQQLTANMMWEGVRVLKKHGIKEVKVPNLPSWMLLRLSVTLPSFIVVPIFKKKMEISAINSMAQDLASGSDKTELEDLNGYLVSLAERLNVEVPYNKGVYQLFKKWNAKGAQPLTPAAVLNHVKSLDNL